MIAQIILYNQLRSDYIYTKYTHFIYIHHTWKIKFQWEDLNLNTKSKIIDYAGGKTLINNLKDEWKTAEFLCENIRSYLIDEKAKSGLTLTDLNEILIGKRKSDLIAKRYFGTSQWELPTKEMYLKLQTTGYFRKEFEELRKEFEELRRPFNNRFNLQEVLNFSNEQAKTGAKYDHDTVKPETLTRALILTCSRENDLVVVPFAGSGTECAMSVKEKRNFVAYEITKKHAEMSQERANKILKEPTLF